MHILRTQKSYRRKMLGQSEGPRETSKRDSSQICPWKTSSRKKPSSRILVEWPVSLFSRKTSQSYGCWYADSGASQHMTDQKWAFFAISTHQTWDVAGNRNRKGSATFTSTWFRHSSSHWWGRRKAAKWSPARSTVRPKPWGKSFQHQIGHQKRL